MKGPINIFNISFDRREILRKNPEEIIEKLSRDKMGPDYNNFLLFSWGLAGFRREISKNILGINLKSRFSHFRPLYDLLSIFYAPYIAWKNKFAPDIFIVGDFPLVFSGLLFKFFWGSKIFIVVSNLPKDLLKTRPHKNIRIFYQALAEYFGKFLVDRALVINDATRNYALGVGIDDGKIKLFHPDVISRDAQFIEKSRKGLVREKYGIPGNKKIILSVGRLEKEKGFERLIENFIGIGNRDWILIIAGRGSLESKLRAIIKENGFEDNILLVGYIERDDIWNFYRDADLFLLLPYSEALGLVFWEAMYMKVPVVGSSVGGIIETIGADGDRGFFWRESEGVPGLKNKINNVFKNGKEIETVKDRAFIYINGKTRAGERINDFL